MAHAVFHLPKFRIKKHMAYKFGSYNLNSLHSEFLNHINHRVNPKFREERHSEIKPIQIWEYLFEAIAKLNDLQSFLNL